MRRSRLKPAVLLGALSAACLVVFLATIPLPRIDGQLIGGDGAGYYAYLPSVILDRDLDFANQYAALMPRGLGSDARFWPAQPWCWWRRTSCSRSSSAWTSPGPAGVRPGTTWAHGG